MNFFEHQDRARRQSRWLIVVFALAVLAIVLAIDAIVLLTLGVTTAADGEQTLGAAYVKQLLAELEKTLVLPTDFRGPPRQAVDSDR